MINADKNKKKIYADSLLYADLTYQVRGAIFAVYNELGFGHKENVYQKALIRELEDKKISYKKEQSLKVTYKNEVIGHYRPDLVIDEKIIVELKAVEFIPKSFETQLLQYLKATGFTLGLLINFGSPKLYIKRLANSYPRKSVINPRESVFPQSGTERR